jgi:hypothetical protein
MEEGHMFLEKKNEVIGMMPEGGYSNPHSHRSRVIRGLVVVCLLAMTWLACTASAQGGDQTVPTLKVLQPTDGETITLPAEIYYEVTGLEAGDSPYYAYMNVFVGEDPEESFQIEIPLESQSGVAELPDDKRLPGRKDLTFQLARADHTLLSNPEAIVTIRELVIEGRR